MAVVLDANLLVALASDEAQAQTIEEHFSEWAEIGEELHAPALMPYEVANALTRLIAAGQLAVETLAEVWVAIGRVPITYHALSDGAATVEVALRLGRRSAYDAAYVQLALALNAELWTLDGPLARNATDQNLPVRLIIA